jgi:hypothetical protein
MSKMSAYSALLSRAGKKLEKMIETDFPGNPELTSDIEMEFTKIQFMIMNEFLKGDDKNG